MNVESIISKAETGDSESKVRAIVNRLKAMPTIFWQADNLDIFATMARGGHFECYKVNTRGFEHVVRVIFGEPISEYAMNEVLRWVEALAVQNPDTRKPAVRVADGDDAIIIDLGTRDWKFIRIAHDGWTIEAALDVPLWRPKGLLPLPIPRRDNRPPQEILTEIAKVLNLVGEDGKPNASIKLWCAWLVGALFPDIPYPILSVDGEAGAAKTSFCRFTRALIDPNIAPLRSPPKTIDDLVISAVNSRVLAYDNLSSLSAEMADGLCRVATGSGLGKRQLHTDGEEFLIQARRPVIVNGINSMLTRGDLASRAVTITQAPISDDARRTERSIDAAFEQIAPAMLGLLCTALVTAIRNLPTTKLPALPRMADWTALACAAAPAFGWTGGDMHGAIMTNQGAVIMAVAENDVLAVAMKTFMAAQPAGEWQGSPEELLRCLSPHVALSAQHDKKVWPSNAVWLTRKLRPLAPALRAVGVQMELPTASGREGRRISLSFEKDA